MENSYGKMSLAELKSFAKEKGMTGVSTKKKQELIDLLSAADSLVKPASAGDSNAQNQINASKQDGTSRQVNASARENGGEAGNNTKADQRKPVETGKEAVKKADENNEIMNNGIKNKEAENKSSAEKTEKSPVTGRDMQGRPVQSRPVRENTRFQDNQGERQIRRPAAGRNEGVNRRESWDSKNRQQQSRTNRPAQENVSSAQTQNSSADGSYTVSNNSSNTVNSGNTANQGAAAVSQNTGNNYSFGNTAVPEGEQQLDSGETKSGILEVMAEGYGFIRCDNFLPGSNDVYVSPIQIRRMNLKTGDIIIGNTKIRNQNEKFSALLYVKLVNGLPPSEALKRPKFEDLVPIYPNSRIHLETPGCKPAMRMVDLISPIGKGQRGMIVSQPKAGKTTLLKQIATAVTHNHPEMHMIILLIDERPEEVTDMKESIQGEQVEVIYSTFDELPENHKRVSEMVIERAKRLVEHGKDVIILLDSITRLARAYNLTVQASGRTLSGGLDPAALYMPKRFFGAARNMRGGGSLTILATALVETGSRMDDVVFEEFKGTGNMELVLDRNLSERRVFPAIDLPRSSTRRDDLLLSPAEQEANMLMRKAFNGARSDDAVEKIIQMFAQTKNNTEFMELIKKTKIGY